VIFKWIVLGIDAHRKVLVNQQLTESPMGETFVAALAVLHKTQRLEPSLDQFWLFNDSMGTATLLSNAL
jgi:hypothetical protein